MSKVCIRTYSLKVDADLAKLRLDDLGIKSDVVTIDGVFAGAIGGFELRVDGSQYQRAIKFIETYEKDIAENSEESEDEN